MARNTKVLMAVVWSVSAVVWGTVSGPAKASDFATEVVSYYTGTSATPPKLEHPTYVNPLTALGEPTRVTGAGVWPGDVTMFNPPWMDTEIVSIGRGGHLTVKFDHPVHDNAPGTCYGLDLIVFGNAGFVDWSGLAAGLFGADGGNVRVSQDGLTWFDIVGVTVDDVWPTLGYTDTSGPYANDGATPTDFTIPVNPNADPSNKTFAELVALYNGSGGGTGIDIASTGLDWIQYVNVWVSDTAAFDVEIDGFADVVPEPATLALLVLGAGVALRRRRQ